MVDWGRLRVGLSDEKGNTDGQILCLHVSPCSMVSFLLSGRILFLVYLVHVLFYEIFSLVFTIVERSIFKISHGTFRQLTRASQKCLRWLLLSTCFFLCFNVISTELCCCALAKA